MTHLPLSADEIDCLRCIAGHMIPASDEHGVPGADDAAIIADMVGSPTRDHDELLALLRHIQAAAGGALPTLPHADQASLLATLRNEQPGRFAVVEAVVSRAYYRDDRVLTAIGMPARAPFPSGFQVEQGDWSLLDPVRARGRMFRDAD